MLSRVERGQRGISLRLAFAFQHAYGVPAETWIGTNEKGPD